MENPTKGGGRYAGKNDPLPDGEAGAAARELSRPARRGKPVPGGRASHGGRRLYGRRPALSPDGYIPPARGGGSPAGAREHPWRRVSARKKEANRLFCADMCRRGFVVFCLEYPLVPDVDIFTVFRALTAGIDRAAALAPDFGGDASKLLLCGDSAGAYLCVYLAAMRKNTAMARAAGVPQLSADIAALGLISGMFYGAYF